MKLATEVTFTFNNFVNKLMDAPWGGPLSVSLSDIDR